MVDALPEGICRRIGQGMVKCLMENG